MPVILPNEVYYNNTPGAGNLAAFASADDQVISNAVATATGNRQNTSFLGGLAGIAFGATLDTFDLIPSSLGFTKRGEINRAALRATGSPNLLDWYNNNRGAIDLGSLLPTIIVSELAAAKALSTANNVVKGLGKQSFAYRLAGLDDQYDRAAKLVAKTELLSAQRGFHSAEQYGGQIALLGGLTITPNKAVNNFVRKTVKRGFARNVIAEGIFTGIANSNELVFGDDFGDNVAFLALGLGAGSVIDNLQAKHIARSIAGSDVVRRAQAEAYDPFGTEHAKLSAVLKEFDVDEAKEWEQFSFAGGGYTDLGTSHQIFASELRNATATTHKGLISNKDALATQHDELALQAFNKVTARGLPGVVGSNAAATDAGFKQAINFARTRDPAAFSGVEYMGSASFDQLTQRSEFVKSSIARVQDTLSKGGKIVNGRLKKMSPSQAEAMRAKLKRLKHEQSLTPVYIIQGERLPSSVGKMFDNVRFDKPIKEQTDDEYALWQIKDANNYTTAVDVRGDVFLPSYATKFADLTMQHSIDAYRAGSKFAEYVSKSTKAKLELPPKPTWFQLELAEEILKRSNDPSKVVFPIGMDRRAARVESFKLRALELQSLFAKATPEELLEAKYKYNLPMLSAAEQGLLMTTLAPTDVLLKGMAKKGSEDKLKDITYEELIKAIDDVSNITDLTADSIKKSDPLSGNMFSFMHYKGQPMKPLVALVRDVNPFEYTKDNLAERLAQRKAFYWSSLSNPTSQAFNREISSFLVSSADFRLATEIGELRDAQHRSSLPFFDQSPNKTLNDFISRETRDRDNPNLLGVSRLKDSVDRLSRSLMERELRETMVEPFAEITKSVNGKSKALADQYGTFASGWDFSTKRVTRTAPDGTTVYAFELLANARNKKRWQQTYQEEMPEGATLRNPQGVEIVLDDLALRYWDNFHKAADKVRLMKNDLNKALGIRAIAKKNNYTPPPNPDGKYIGFSLDTEGNVLPNGTIVAQTEAEFLRQKRILEDPSNEFSPLNKEGVVFKTKTQVENFQDLWEQAAQDFINPTRTPVQPGKVAQGKLVGQSINPRAVEDSMVYLRNQYLQQGQDIVRNSLREQINAAKARSSAFKPDARSGKAEDATTNTPNVFDYYLKNLYGTSATNDETSLVGSLQRKLGDDVDRFLRDSQPKRHEIMSKVYERTAGKILPWESKSQKAQAEFVKLRNELGPYMPFRNATEYMERNYGVKPPPELQGIMNDLNKFQATVILRMDVIHPLMNLAGILNAAPAVIRNYQLRPGETLEDLQRRTGHSAQIFELGPDRKPITILDMPKLIASAFRDARNVKMHPHYDRWQSKGYTAQEITEVQKQMSTVVETREGWKAWMLGNPQGKTNIERQGIVGVLSTLSDKSEDFSRTWAHIVGFKLAENLGIKNLDTMDDFAHDVANKMIANYNPINRPAIFQGPLGVPFGLFQSFVLNYFQNMFRYLETNQLRTAAMQYATQSSLFGVTTVPGFDQINNFFFEAGAENDSPLDQIYDKFNPHVADFMMGGVFSNLPKLINLLPGEQGFEGIDFSSRGDTNIRLPGFNGLPIFNLVSRVKDAINQGLYAVSAENPQLTDRQLAEIVSNMSINRPFAGIVEQFAAGGNDTDSYGQIVTDTKNWAESITRVIGVRSFRQSKELEAYYGNKNSEELRNAKMADLRFSLRAAIRNQGEIDLEDYQIQYLTNGGDPKRFARFLRDQIEVATESRAERMLKKLAKNPTKAELVDRLIDLGVRIQDDEEFGAENPYITEELIEETAANIPEGYDNPALTEDIEAYQQSAPDNYALRQ